MKKIYFNLVHFFSALIAFISYNGHCQSQGRRDRSEDHYHFSRTRTLQKRAVTNNNNYKFVHSIKNGNKTGFYFSRIKPVYSKEGYKVSDMRSVELKSSRLQKLNFYSDPSDGIVGIKFDDIFGGNLFTQVINTQGQSAENKKILGSGYCVVKLQGYKGAWTGFKDVTAIYSV